MKLPLDLTALFLYASLTSAQLLSNGNGQLPGCASRCSVLTSAESSCGGTQSNSLSIWSCFCAAVWTNSGQSPTTICSTSCSASDDALVGQWYTENCGADNGASEHGGTGTSSGAGSSAAPSVGPSTTATGVEAGGGDGSDCTTWFSCHWKWVVMIIIVAVGLLILGFGGRWLKRRHDRKQDQIREGFNSGITERSAPVNNDKANDSRAGPGLESGGGRDTPTRTRDAFMPYGYGYSRSESRQVPNEPRAVDVEKYGGSGANDDAPRRTGRRVMVRERSSDAR